MQVTPLQPQLQRALRTPRNRRRSRLIFETLEKRYTLSTLAVTSTSDSGDGSLRQALAAANATAELDTIVFDIPADDPGHVYYRDDQVAGQVSLSQVAPTQATEDALLTDADPDWPHSWYSIQIATGELGVSRPVVIDGYSQPGSVSNSSVDGFDAILRIEIEGDDRAANGLLVSGGSSQFQGLVINRTRSNGIYLWIRDDNVVTGNVLGADVSGTIPLGSSTGVLINSDFSKVVNSGLNQIGGTEAADRNLISGNRTAGVWLDRSAENRVQGNLIGTARDGRTALGNGVFGIQVNHFATSHLIGGSESGAANVIAFNGGMGVNIGSRSIEGLVVEGNRIHSNATHGISNAADGTRIRNNAIYGQQGHGINSSGQSASIVGNAIYENDLAGVRVGAGRATISGNSIYANTGLGIDLVGGNEDTSGVTANDEGDQDAGANNLQNYPVLSRAQSVNQGTLIQGELSSSASTEYQLEFFASSELDPSGHGEGRIFLGTESVTTDEMGLVDFSADLPTPTEAGQYVTATATRVSRVEQEVELTETSEFSLGRQVDGSDLVFDLGFMTVTVNEVDWRETPGDVAADLLGVTIDFQGDLDPLGTATIASIVGHDDINSGDGVIDGFTLTDATLSLSQVTVGEGGNELALEWLTLINPALTAPNFVWRNNQLAGDGLQISADSATLLPDLESGGLASANGVIGGIDLAGGLSVTATKLLTTAEGILHIEGNDATLNFFSSEPLASVTDLSVRIPAVMADGESVDISGTLAVDREGTLRFLEDMVDVAIPLDGISRQLGILDVLPLHVESVTVGFQQATQDLTDFSLLIDARLSEAFVSQLPFEPVLEIGTAEPAEENLFARLELYLPALLGDEPRMVLKQAGPITLGLREFRVGEVVLGGTVHLGSITDGTYEPLPEGIRGTLSIESGMEVLEANQDGVAVEGATLALTGNYLPGDANQPNRLEFDVSGEVDLHVKLQDLLELRGMGFQFHAELTSPVGSLEPSFLFHMNQISVQHARMEFGELMVIEAGGEDEQDLGVLFNFNDPQQPGEIPDVIAFFPSLGVSFPSLDDFGGELTNLSIGSNLVPRLTDPEVGVALSFPEGSLQSLFQWLPLTVDELGIGFQAGFFERMDDDPTDEDPGVIVGIADPTAICLTLGGGISSIEVDGETVVPIDATVQGLELDIQKLADGEFPVKDLEGFTIALQPFELVEGFQIGGGLQLGTIDIENGGVTEEVLWGRIFGDFQFEGYGGGAELIISQYGPLAGSIEIPLAITLGQSGIMITGVEGTLQFGREEPLPAVESALDLNGDEFQNPIDIDFGDPDVIRGFVTPAVVDGTPTWGQTFVLAMAGSISHVAVAGLLSGRVTLGTNVGLQGADAGLALIGFGDIQMLGINLVDARVLVDLRDELNPVVAAAIQSPPSASLLSLLLPAKAEAGLLLDTQGMSLLALHAFAGFFEEIAEGALSQPLIQELVADFRQTLILAPTSDVAEAFREQLGGELTEYSVEQFAAAGQDLLEAAISDFGTASTTVTSLMQTLQRSLSRLVESGIDAIDLSDAATRQDLRHEWSLDGPPPNFNDAFVRGLSTLTIALDPEQITDGGTILLGHSDQQQVFEFDNNQSIADGHLAIPFAESDTWQALADALVSVAQQVPGLSPVHLGQGVVEIGAGPLHCRNPEPAGLASDCLVVNASGVTHYGSVTGMNAIARDALLQFMNILRDASQAAITEAAATTTNDELFDPSLTIEAAISPVIMGIPLGDAPLNGLMRLDKRGFVLGANFSVNETLSLLGAAAGAASTGGLLPLLHSVLPLPFSDRLDMAISFPFAGNTEEQAESLAALLDGEPLFDAEGNPLDFNPLSKNWGAALSGTFNIFDIPTSNMKGLLFPEDALGLLNSTIQKVYSDLESDVPAIPDTTENIESGDFVLDTSKFQITEKRFFESMLARGGMLVGGGYTFPAWLRDPFQEAALFDPPELTEDPLESLREIRDTLSDAETQFTKVEELAQVQFFFPSFASVLQLNENYDVETAADVTQEGQQPRIALVQDWTESQLVDLVSGAFFEGRLNDKILGIELAQGRVRGDSESVTISGRVPWLGGLSAEFQVGLPTSPDGEVLDVPIDGRFIDDETGQLVGDLIAFPFPVVAFETQINTQDTESSGFVDYVALLESWGLPPALFELPEPAAVSLRALSPGFNPSSNDLLEVWGGIQLRHELTLPGLTAGPAEFTFDLIPPSTSLIPGLQATAQVPELSLPGLVGAPSEWFSLNDFEVVLSNSVDEQLSSVSVDGEVGLFGNEYAVVGELTVTSEGFAGTLPIGEGLEIVTDQFTLHGDVDLVVAADGGETRALLSISDATMQIRAAADAGEWFTIENGSFELQASTGADPALLVQASGELAIAQFPVGLELSDATFMFSADGLAAHAQLGQRFVVGPGFTLAGAAELELNTTGTAASYMNSDGQVVEVKAGVFARIGMKDANIGVNAVRSFEFETTSIELEFAGSSTVLVKTSTGGPLEITLFDQLPTLSFPAGNGFYFPDGTFSLTSPELQFSLSLFGGSIAAELQFSFAASSGQSIEFSGAFSSSLGLVVQGSKIAQVSGAIDPHGCLTATAVFFDGAVVTSGTHALASGGCGAQVMLPASLTVLEGNTEREIEVPVTLSKASEQEVVAYYRVGTLDGFPSPFQPAGDDDFQAVAEGSVTFSPGDLEPDSPLLVTIVGDEEPELDEAFVVQLTRVMHGAIGAGTAIVTIENDDFDLPERSHLALVHYAFQTGENHQTWHLAPNFTNPAVDATDFTHSFLSHGVPAGIPTKLTEAGVVEYINGFGVSSADWDDGDEYFEFTVTSQNLDPDILEWWEKAKPVSVDWRLYWSLDDFARPIDVSTVVEIDSEFLDDFPLPPGVSSDQLQGWAKRRAVLPFEDQAQEFGNTCVDEPVTFRLYADRAVSVDNVALLGSVGDIVSCNPELDTFIGDALQFIDATNISVDVWLDGPGSLLAALQPEINPVTFEPTGRSSLVSLTVRDTDARTTLNVSVEDEAAAETTALEIGEILVEGSLNGIDTSGVPVLQSDLIVDGNVATVLFAGLADKSSIEIRNQVGDITQIVATGDIGHPAGLGVDLLSAGTVAVDVQGWYSGSWAVDAVTEVVVRDGDFAAEVQIQKGFDSFEVRAGDFKVRSFESGIEQTPGNGDGGSITAAAAGDENRGGSITADRFIIDGDLSELKADGGDISGNFRAQRLGTVEAYARDGRGGDIGGALEALSVDRVLSAGGTISTSIRTTDAGHEALRVLATGPGGRIESPRSFNLAGGAAELRARSVNLSLTAGGHIELIQVGSDDDGPTGAPGKVAGEWSAASIGTIRGLVSDASFRVFTSAPASDESDLRLELIPTVGEGDAAENLLIDIHNPRGVFFAEFGGRRDPLQPLTSHAVTVTRVAANRLGANVSRVVSGVWSESQSIQYATSDSRFEIQTGELQLRSDNQLGVGEFPVEVAATAASHQFTQQFYLQFVSWTNSPDHLDVDNSGAVVPFDVLVSINGINRLGVRELVTARGVGESFYDVNGDGFHTAADVLLIINWLNRAAGLSGPEAAEPERATSFPPDFLSLPDARVVMASTATPNAFCVLLEDRLPPTGSQLLSDLEGGAMFARGEAIARIDQRIPRQLALDLLLAAEEITDNLLLLGDMGSPADELCGSSRKR